MGSCCSKSKVKDEEDKKPLPPMQIIEKYKIDKVEELSSISLKYGGERCSQKWYTSSVYSGIQDDKQKNFTMACCERELSFLSKLTHINIVKLIGVHCKPNNPQPISALVTEEVTSNILYHLDKVKTLKESEKLMFSCGVSEGLAYLHKQNIAHLNLSTKSIFLTHSLVVKIANFEYAMYFTKPDDTTVHVRPSSSSSASLGGKLFSPLKFRDDQSVFNFLPPNFFDIRPYNVVDIYSFGCIVFNIFTLKQPTRQIASQAKEISVLGVQSLVSKCVCDELERMQEVNEALKNVCLKESSNSVKEPAQDVCEAVVHHELHRKESDQDINTNSAVSSIEVERHAQTECNEDAVIPQEILDTYDQSERISNAPKADEKNESDLTEKDLKQKLEEMSTSSEIQKKKLKEANDKVKELTTHLAVKDEDIETRSRSLTEKTNELKKCKEECESIQTELKSQAEKLKNDNKRLEQVVQNKEIELAEAKENYKSLELTMTQQIEELKRASEVSNVELADKQKTDSTECKDVAVIPQQNLQKQLDKLKKENSTLISKLTKLEEQSFSFTNAFTTAGEGSVIKLRDTYRNLQANTRPAANRAHKKVYKGIELPIAEHTMIAYEAAKKLALQEFEIVSERLRSLFKLKTTEKDASAEQHPKAMIQGQQLLDSFHSKPLNEEIYQVLIDKYKALTNQAETGIPKAVEDYYSSIAKFAWDCVSRTIPMILSTDVTAFDGEMHETGDGDTEDDNEIYKGKDVTYIYPILLTSNSWPREIALKGKVKVSKDSTISSSKDIASEGKIKLLQDNQDNDII